MSIRLFNMMINCWIPFGSPATDKAPEKPGHVRSTHLRSSGSTNARKAWCSCGFWMILDGLTGQKCWLFVCLRFFPEWFSLTSNIHMGVNAKPGLVPCPSLILSSEIQSESLFKHHLWADSMTLGNPEVSEVGVPLNHTRLQIGSSMKTETPSQWLRVFSGLPSPSGW